MAKFDETATVGALAEEVQERLRPLLRARVGNRSGQIPPDVFQDVTGIGASRLKALKEAGRGQPPTLEQFLLIAEQFGLPALDPVLELIGFQAQPRDNSQHLQTNPFTVLRALAKRLDAMTDRLEDGIFDPKEKLDSARDLEELSRELASFIQGWRAELGR